MNEAGLLNVMELQYFTAFSEYFISISLLYTLILITLLTCNNSGLVVQRSLSHCLALILFMSWYLMNNNDSLYSKPSLEDSDKSTIKWFVMPFTSYFEYMIYPFFREYLSFTDSIINDFLSFFIKSLLCFFLVIYFLVISDSLNGQKITSFEYSLILLFAILGLLLMCNSNDFLTVYLSIELSSLAFYIMASFRKTSRYSVEAGVKYFITGAISSSFFLLGASIIYKFTGSLNFDIIRGIYNTTTDMIPFSAFGQSAFFLFSITPFKDIGKLIVSQQVSDIFFSDYNLYLFTDSSRYLGISFSEIGLMFILFSIFIKLSAAPFHLWSLDVYEGSPTSSTIFFAVFSKLSLLVLLIRLLFGVFFGFDSWKVYTFWSGVACIFVSSLGGLRQRRLKTLMAYNSVGSIGYILLAFSTCTLFGFESILFYLVNYLISGLCFWSILLTLKLKRQFSFNKYNKELSNLALLRKSNGSLAFSVSIVLFSIAGIPPLSGFVAKMLILTPLLITDYFFILTAVFVILMSVISTFYCIRVIKVVYFENILVGELYYPSSGPKVICLTVLLFLILFLLINPTLICIFSHKVAFVFNYYEWLGIANFSTIDIYYLLAFLFYSKRYSNFSSFEEILEDVHNEYGPSDVKRVAALENLNLIKKCRYC